MKCQSLFSGTNTKNVSNCCLLKFLPSMLSIKSFPDHGEHACMIINIVSPGPSHGISSLEPTLGYMAHEKIAFVPFINPVIYK